ncbi:MAG TPA: MerC domain-containing protein [Woeseiaceae bacterium]|nr:MerC domain-containing protein [Woeseiaceae bacterium]
MVNSALKPAVTLDRVAVILSGLCLLHCLALPFLLVSLPAISAFSEGHLHAQMLILAIPVSVIALTFGFRRHGSRYIVAFGVLGMLLLVIGGTVAHTYYGLVADRAFSISGALVLAVTHYFNSRRIRHCRAVGVAD